MVSLLNRFAWVLSGTIAFMPVFIDEDFFILSCIAFFLIKFFVFSNSLIENAVKNMNVGSSINNDLPTSISSEENTNPITSDLTEDSTVINESYEDFKRDYGENTGVNSSPMLDSIIKDSENTIHDSGKNSFVDDLVIQSKEEEPSALNVWLHNFFSDRPLAKVGGILLFLGALFFLGLIYNNIGERGKVLMGIIFGFFLIGIGFYLDKKNSITESRVLFGIGLAVNYLTILFGSYLIDGADAFIGDGLATVMLLLNTGFAIVLALVYHSRVLLGFAFIFAYLTPFLIGSHSSSVYLLSFYTTVITLAISIIIVFYNRTQEQQSIEYLEGISVIGMTALFTLATAKIHNSIDAIIVGSGLLISVIALSYYSYTMKRSPIAVFIGSYIVLFFLTFIHIDSFLTLPFILIIFVTLVLFLTMQSIVSSIVFGIVGGCTFFLGFIGFLISGGDNIIMLLLLGTVVFGLFSVVILHIRSIFLSAIAIAGFGLTTLLGFSVLSTELQVDSVTVLLTKSVSIILLLGASIFTLRLREASIFFMAIIMTGVLIVYPNVIQYYPWISLGSSIFYFILSLTIPYLLTSDKGQISRHSFLIGSLPLSTIVISYTVYQFGQSYYLNGVGMGFAFILEAGAYLAYALIAGKSLIQGLHNPLTPHTNEEKSTILTLFAIPLSLFTFSIAFIFNDIPSMMSLAWVIESVILYLVATRMQDDRIFFAGHLVLFVGLVKEFTLLGNIYEGEWLNFGILSVMCLAIFASLFVLKGEKSERRVPYDILHIASILLIGSGIAQIIPTTGTGWSIFGPATFLVVLSLVYGKIGNRIHHILFNILLGGLFFAFLVRFPNLIKNDYSLLVQFSTLILIYIAGYIHYNTARVSGIVSLTISLVTILVMSSFYVNEFFGVFAVSIYLAIIATILIIRGITLDSSRRRTVGLYIGIFVLFKILLFDVWNNGGDLVIRVIALMVTGGLMIYLSQLYGKFVSRSWSDELKMSNIFPNASFSSDKIVQETPSSPTESKQSPVEESSSEIDPFVGNLYEEMKDYSVSGYSGVTFIGNTGEKFYIKRISIIRLARYICDKLGKTEFGPNELNSAYTYVLDNLSSSLPKNQLDSLLAHLKGWIVSGGRVEFSEKKNVGDKNDI